MKIVDIFPPLRCLPGFLLLAAALPGCDRNKEEQAAPAATAQVGQAGAAKPLQPGRAYIPFNPRDIVNAPAEPAIAENSAPGGAEQGTDTPPPANSGDESGDRASQVSPQAGVVPGATGAGSPSTQAPQRQSAALDPVTCKKPEYPKASARAEETGTSTIAFSVTKEGTVAKAWLQKSSGFRALDRAALDALSLCRFMPAIEDSKPVDDTVAVQYVWTLE